MDMPKDVKALSDTSCLQITWQDDRVVRFPFVKLRASCGCANCVHEFTGEQLLDPTTIPDDIKIEQMALAGNYALKIVWSDGHSSGIFTWQRLRDLAPVIGQEGSGD